MGLSGKIDKEIKNLAQRIGAEIKCIKIMINGNQCDLSGLDTHDKTNLVAAINEVYSHINANDTDLSVENRTSVSLEIHSSTGDDITLNAANLTLAGLMSALDKAKLDDIEANATANATDTFLVNRANHTGTQPVNTISGFNSAVDVRVLLILDDSNPSLTTTYSSTKIENIISTLVPLTGYNNINWDTSYSWGNHASEGYLTSYTETDPIFTNSAAFGISGGNISNWNTAHGWGNHASAGYLTSELDPVFTGSPAFGITSNNINNWDDAFSWGDHSLAGYLTSMSAETDPVFSASTAASIAPIDLTNWNEAHGWGDHSSVGYLTSESDPVFTGSPAFGVTSTNITDWNNAFSWGDHSFAGYEQTSNKGVANGYVPLNGSVLIDSIFLPSYVDDVLEFDDSGDLPVTGETGKIYITLDNNNLFRWSGSVYVPVGGTSSIAWGSITGTLANQTDLQNALNGKSNTGHTHTFASLTSKPTTIAGYGITDFNSLGDARWAPITHNHTAAQITSGTFANARIAQGNVTQHQAALSITESQISDFGNYLSALSAGSGLTVDNTDPNNPIIKLGGALTEETFISYTGDTYRNVQILVRSSDWNTFSMMDVTSNSVSFQRRDPGNLNSSFGMSVNGLGVWTEVELTIRTPNVYAETAVNGQVLTLIDATTGEVEFASAGGGGVTDHGALTGLGDDDHTQYYNQSRGDARYSQLGHTHTFASLTSKPTTIGGYGITDFNSLGDARWLGVGGTAANATTLAGLGVGSFLRSDAADQKTSGELTLNDNIELQFGTSGGESHIFSNGTNTYWDLVSGDLIVRDGSTTRVTIARTTGNITAAAFFESSDRTLKQNIEHLSGGIYKFEFKKQPGQLRYSPIAQEVQETNPELVGKDTEGKLTVNMVDFLCLKLAEKDQKINDLEKRLEKLEQLITNQN